MKINLLGSKYTLDLKKKNKIERISLRSLVDPFSFSCDYI